MTRNDKRKAVFDDAEKSHAGYAPDSIMNKLIRTYTGYALAGAFLSAIAVPAVRATLLFSEDFNYTIGANLPVSPSSGDAWGSSGGGTTTVAAQTLTPYSAGGLTVTSTGGQVVNTNRTIYHNFAETDLLTSVQREAGGELYISFVATIANPSADGGNVDIKFQGSKDVRVSVGTAWKSTQWGLNGGSFQNANVSTLTAALIVLKIAWTDADTVNFSLYVNPEATVSGSVISALASAPNQTLNGKSFGYLDQISLVNNAAGATITMDALKIGTTLADVVAPTPVPEPASSVALVGGAGLLCVVLFRAVCQRR